MGITIKRSGSVLCALPGVRSAGWHGTVDGERTFSFTVPLSGVLLAAVGDEVVFNSDIFDIVRISKQTAIPEAMATIETEHVSYRLADMEQPAAVFAGTAAAVLAQILSGTGFSVGTASIAGTYTLTIKEDTNKRDALQQWVATVGGELQYSGMSISIVPHVGSSVRAELSDKRNVQSISVTLDSRSETQTYAVTLYRETALLLGDEVSITYPSLGLAVNSRIIAMEYDPFQQRQYNLTCGENVPNWTNSVISSLRERVVEGRSYYGTTISRDSGLEIEKIDPAADMLYPNNNIFPGGDVFPGYQTAAVRHTRAVLNSDTLAFYGEDGTLDFGWDNVSKHFKLLALASEVDRATGVEATLSAAIEVNADAIDAEVTRASDVEGTLSGRISINADAIATEVERAGSAETALGTSILQTVDSISMTVSYGSDGTSFIMKRGSVTIDTETVDLHVKSVNVDGDITAQALNVIYTPTGGMTYNIKTEQNAIKFYWFGRHFGTIEVDNIADFSVISYGEKLNLSANGGYVFLDGDNGIAIGAASYGYAAPTNSTPGTGNAGAIYFEIVS